MKEIRHYQESGLICPNPSQYYKMIKSYKDMKMEYDLLNCYKYTDEEILLLTSKLIQKNFSHLPYLLMFSISFIIFLCSIV